MPSSGESQGESLDDVGPTTERRGPRSVLPSDDASSRAIRFFDAIAGRYERSYALETRESRRRMAWVLGVLLSPPARLLDLGVGTGRELPSLLDRGYLVTGLDASTAMIERCSRRARPIRLVNADFWRQLPFEAASFDAVVALHGTLAHAPDEGALGRLAAEVARVTAEGAVWVIEMPSPAWLEEVERGEGLGDCAIRRTGPRTGVCEDSIASASIDVRVLSEEEWRAALEPWWDCEIEDATGLGGELRRSVEWRVVARKR